MDWIDLHFAVRICQAEDRYSQSRHELLDQMAYAMGGRPAEAKPPVPIPESHTRSAGLPQQ